MLGRKIVSAACFASADQDQWRDGEEPLPDRQIRFKGGDSIADIWLHSRNLRLLLLYA